MAGWLCIGTVRQQHASNTGISDTASKRERCEAGAIGRQVSRGAACQDALDVLCRARMATLRDIGK